MHEGGCLCHRLRYAVDNEPLHVINCHCKFCQRSTGSASLVETLFDRDNLKIINGSPKTWDHVSEGSGKNVRIHFCDNCGTKIYLTFEYFPDIAGVYSGTFDDPNWFPQNPENTQYFFLGEAQEGSVVPAGFEVFHGHFRNHDGSENRAHVFEEHTRVTAKVKKAIPKSGR